MLRSMCGTWLRYPELMVASFWRWLFDWFTSRSVFALLLAMPAVLSSAAAVWAFAGSGSYGEPIAERYQRAGMKALEANNFVWAERLFYKSARHAQDPREAQFALARLAELSGRPDRAARLFERLAPSDQPGYPPAHAWRAEKLLGTQRSVDGPTLALLKHHLQQAALAPDARPQVHAVLAEIYLQEQQTQAALERLKRAAARDPRYQLVIGRVLLQTGQAAEARDALTTAKRFFEEQLEKSPDNFESAYGLAQVLLLSEQYEQGEAALREILDRYPTGAAEHLMTRELLVSLYVAWSERLGRESGGAIQQRLVLLERALPLAPQSEAVLLEVGRIAAAAESESRAIELLRQALARGTAPALIHTILGTHAAAALNYASAQLHLEEANRLQPNNRLIVNNLAWTLAHVEPAELERALQLIEPFVAEAPMGSLPRAELCETRGVILAKLGRHREAISDLEAALAAYSDRRHLHEQLANCYEACGETELAREHRQLSTPPP